MFDPYNANFSLKSTSPGIDAGKQLNGLNQDIAGTEVPAGSGPDIGAIESKSDMEKEALFSTQMQVYPNPSAGEFELSVQIVETIDALVEIFDLYGKKVISEVFPSLESGEFRRRINLSHVPSGIYLMKAVLGKEVLSTRLIIH
jgi:hypothetical protein